MSKRRAALDLNELHELLQDGVRAALPLLSRRVGDALPPDEVALAARLHAHVERERQAIAREVHDDIGGSLAAINFDLAWIGRHTTDRAVRAHAEAALQLLQHAIGASQRIVQNLRPDMLDQGLVAAIQWLATDFARRTGIQTLFTAARDILDVPEAVQLVTYRTAQESLTNIVKHAGVGCSKVTIDLSDELDVLTLEITDNGRGFARRALARAGSSGLRGLNERAATVGGWLDVVSQPEAGTSIILTAPLQGARARGSGQGTA